MEVINKLRLIKIDLIQMNINPLLFGLKIFLREVRNCLKIELLKRPYSTDPNSSCISYLNVPKFNQPLTHVHAYGQLLMVDFYHTQIIIIYFYGVWLSLSPVYREEMATMEGCPWSSVIQIFHIALNQLMLATTPYQWH